MKMKKSHYKTLKTAFDIVHEKYPESLAGYRSINLSDKRWRWDLFSYCGKHCLLPEGFVTEDLYWYLNDDHIDTALRKITGTK